MALFHIRSNNCFAKMIDVFPCHCTKTYLDTLDQQPAKTSA